MPTDSKPLEERSGRSRPPDLIRQRVLLPAGACHSGLRRPSGLSPLSMRQKLFPNSYSASLLARWAEAIGQASPLRAGCCLNGPSFLGDEK